MYKPPAFLNKWMHFYHVANKNLSMNSDSPLIGSSCCKTTVESSEVTVSKSVCLLLFDKFRSSEHLLLN